MGSNQENSIVGDSKDTKESTVPVRRRKRETWGRGNLLSPAPKDYKPGRTSRLSLQGMDIIIIIILVTTITIIIYICKSYME